jgi:tetratricopeptide (TPR) repeat protein
MSNTLSRIVLAFVVWPMISGCSKQAQAATPAPVVPNQVVADKSPAQEIAELREEIKRKPYDANLELILAYAHLANIVQSGVGTDCGEFEKHTRRAASLDPKLPQIKALLPQIASCNLKYEEAIKLANDAMKENPAQWQFALVVLDAQFELGQYDKAEATLQSLVAHADHESVLIREAKLKEVRGDRDGAATILRSLAQQAEGLEMKPFKKAWLALNAADIDLRRGELESAEAFINKAREYSPSFYLIDIKLAALREAQHRKEEAAALLVNSADVRPWPETLFDLGDLYHSLGNEAMSRESFAKGIEIATRPGFASTLHARQLAKFYLSHDRNLTEALDLITKSNHGDVVGRQLYAWALMKNNRNKEALDEIETALAVGTQDANLFYRAGLIYKANGNKEKAVEYLEKALSTATYFENESDTRIQLAIMTGEKWEKGQTQAGAR